MSKFGFIVLWLLLIGLNNFSEAQVKKKSADSKAEKEVIALVQELAKATLELDAAKYEKIWADNIVCVNPQGYVYGKKETLAGLKSGEVKFERFDVDEINANVWDDTAVVISRQTVKGQAGNHEINEQNRTTDVFVKRKGKWILISESTSLIPTK